MKSAIQVLFLLIMLRGMALGQDTLLISMDDAVQSALEHRKEYQINKLQEQIAGKQTEVARWGKIPSVSGSYDLQRNLIIPTTPVPAKAFDPSAPEGELTPLQFSTKWTSGAGINASYDLFNPIKDGQISEAELKEDITMADTRITEKNLKYNVRNDYVASLIAREQWRLAVADTVNKHQLLEIAASLYRAGRMTDPKLHQPENALTQSRKNYFDALKILKLSLVDLSVSMGLDADRFDLIKLKDSISGWLAGYLEFADNSGKAPELKKITQQEALNRLQAQNQRRTALPIITLSGFLGANYYENKFNIWKGENWYGNSYVKVGVHIPITEGLDRNRKIDVLDLQHQVLQKKYEEELHATQKDMMKVQQNMKYTKKAYDLQKQIMQRNKNDVNIALTRFEAGRLTYDKIIDADVRYRQSKSAYLKALYDHMKAVIEMAKVTGSD